MAKKKRTNWRAIGRAFERKVQAQIEERGYHTTAAGSVLKYLPGGRTLSVREDLFGAFDICMVSPKSICTRWIQVTVGGSKPLAVRKKKVIDAAEKFSSASNLFFLVQRCENKRESILWEWNYNSQEPEGSHWSKNVVPTGLIGENL